MSCILCNHCAEEIEAGDSLSISCFICEKSYHGFKCLGITKPQLNMMKLVKGLLWSCEHCAIKTFPKFVCGKLNEISEKGSIQEDLISRIDNLSAEVSNLKKNVDSLGVPDHPIGGKRARTGPRPATPRLQGSHFEWPKPSTSTSSDKEAIKGTNSDVTTLQVVEIPLYFHVSRFSASTSEDDLTAWVAGKINVTPNQIKCTKLIPKGRAPNELEFVNFKIGITKDLEEKILDPSIWPTNITVRRFEPKPFLPQNQRSYPSIPMQH